MSKSKMRSIELAIGKAAEKPLVNPRKPAHPGPETPPPAPAAPPVAGSTPPNGPAAFAPSPSTPRYRLEKQAISAYMPMGYRQRLREYQIRHEVLPTLTDIMTEALDDFFAKHGVRPVEKVAEQQN